jgi:UDP-N-acetylmuramyl tripeptide synthase
LKLLDSRRLFGPNLDVPGPAAIAEVAFEPEEDAEAALAAWRAHVPPDARIRRFRGGAALVLPGPFDQLLWLCDLNEAAIAGAPPPETPPPVDAALRAVEAQARARGLPVLVDDEQVSVGLGRGARVAARGATDLDWAGAATIPVALVTGTNGKTTSARLLAAIAAAAGHTVGLATTDGIHVGGAAVAAGDYTGPDAARRILRDPRVTLAVLETARGGILRRGLAVAQADVALLTNVAADHLGLYGIDDVDTMARVKGVVGTVADVVVVNGDDPRLAALPFRRRVLFDPADGPTDIPIAFGGAARHNVANAAGAAAAARVLGLGEEAIARGLRGFHENPARGDLVAVGPARVLLDFGHNPEAVRAVLGLARALEPGRLIVVTGLPGDRDDDALRAVAREIAAARPARVYVHDLDGYLRGREPGVVPALVEAALAGAAETERTRGEADGVARALAAAAAGDLIVVFPHLDRDAVAGVLSRGSAGSPDRRGA